MSLSDKDVEERNWQDWKHILSGKTYSQAFAWLNKVGDAEFSYYSKNHNNAIRVGDKDSGILVIYDQDEGFDRTIPLSEADYEPPRHYPF